MNEFPGIQAFLEPNLSLQTNAREHTLHLLYMVNGMPSTRTSNFSAIQWRILIPLLQAYPYYMTYESLLANLRGVSLDVARQQLEKARETKTVRQELKSMRNAIDHINKKLASFHLTLLSIPNRGYILSFLRAKDGNSPFVSVM